MRLDELQGLVSVAGAEYLVWRDRARSHAEARRWKEAVADYTKAIDLDPGDASCWYGRGAAYEKLGRWDEARADYAKAAELKPTDTWYHSRHGFACAQVGRWDEATAALDQDTRKMYYQRLAKAGVTVVTLAARRILPEFHGREIVLPGGSATASGPNAA